MCGLTVNDPIKGRSFCFLIGFLSQLFPHQHPELNAICLFKKLFVIVVLSLQKKPGTLGQGGGGLQLYIFFVHWPSHCGRKRRR